MLTAEEKAELEALRSMDTPQEPTPSRAPGQFPVKNLLTPEEKEELDAIRALENPVPLQQPQEGIPTVSKQEYPKTAMGYNPREGRGSRIATSGEAGAFNDAFGGEASFGYLNNIRAGIESIMPDATGDVDSQLRAQGFQLPERGYVQMRDENIQSQEALAKQYPEQAMAGKVAGIATTMAPVASGLRAIGLAGQGASGFARLGSAAAGGAGVSGIYNPGDTQGVVDVLQLGQRASNAGKGALTGAAGQGVGEIAGGAGAVIKNSSEYFDKVAKTKAFKAAGAMLKDFRKARGDKAAEEVGDTLLKKNIVAAGDGVEDIAEKTVVAKNEAGQKIKGIYGQVKKYLVDVQDDVVEGLRPREKKLLGMTKLDGKKISDGIRTKLGQYQKNNLGSTEVKGKMDEILADLENMGDDIDMSDLLSARNSLDDRIDYAKKANELPLLQKQMSTARQEITRMIQNRVRVVGIVIKDKNLIKDLKLANKEYGQLATVERFAKDKIARDNANRFFSLGDRLTSGTGATVGALTGDTPEERIKNGLIGFVGGRVVAKYGRQSTALAAKGAQSLSKALKVPSNFAKYGEPIIEAAKKSPQELQAILQQFSNDPEFQKLSMKGTP